MKKALLLPLLGAMAVITGIIWWPRTPAPGPTLRSPPDIKVLSADELARTSAHDLLVKVELESTRRVLAGGRGWLSGPQVLSPGACALWVISRVEPAILAYGFHDVRELERQSVQTPLQPSLLQLADAYEVIGQAAAAGLVREAAQAGEAEGPEGHAGFADLDARYRTQIGRGTMGLRLAFARQHRNELFAP